jgi:predicted GH43/DUF377 family glycosyl hydrolase/lysophospholipase L1-like esterase
MKILLLVLSLILPLVAPAKAAGRPNILFAIADDWGPHAGAYGTPWVKTPAFDRIANQGLLFTNAYTPMAKCAPSRAIVLTGRHLWQLEEAGNHLAVFPPKFKSWPEVLTEKGWHVGLTGKGWGPGTANDANGKPRRITGQPYQQRKAQPPASGMFNIDYAANFTDFLDAAPQNTPWCFWYGALEPHRGYEYQSGANKGGKKPGDIDRVPAYWPDTETVRHDMLDYALEVEHADMHLARMIAELEKRGQLDNTIIIVTSDHGMPFPRVKGYAYHDSNHIPLAIRWPGGMKKPGRVIEDFVDFSDIAATVLDVAGIAQADSGMQPLTGKSWRPILESDQAGQVIAARDHTLIGKERTDVGRPHNWGYPIRGIVTSSHLYLKNYEPTRWPAGNPETGYLDTDGSPTKSLVLELGRKDRSDRYWQLNFGLRPGEELYDLKSDTDCVRNLATDAAMQTQLCSLRERMETALKTQGDPRMAGQGHLFDDYKPTGGDGFYEKFTRGEKPKANWVNDSDFEPQPIAIPVAAPAARKRAAPEAGSRAEKKPNDLRIKPDPALPNVLLLGDSISIGYTLPVRQLLKGKANVFRPVNANGGAENCSDTGVGVANLDRWLALQPKWDVIHFNWGLHDLKHIADGKPSSDPSSPVLNSLEVYQANLTKITARLKQTGARLVCATTTPVVEGTTNPFRDPADPARYNAAAVKVAKANGVRVNDLFALVSPQLAAVQLPKNVHFTAAGSDLLAKQVAAVVTEELATAVPPAASTTKPRMMFADTTSTGRPFSKDPSVIRFGDRYLMYFSLPPFSPEKAPANAPRGWSIGIAESTNLTDWKKIGELLPEQECDQNGLCAPGARVLDGKVHLFYQTYGNGPKDAICHAVSADGIRFQRDATNPVFRPTGDWNNGRAIDAEVIPFGDRLLLYFATRDPAGKIQMVGVAAADLKSNYNREAWRQLADKPVLKPELPWEIKCIEAPSIIQRGDELLMFYAGGYNNDPQQVGVASSRDGVTWKRLADEPLLPNGAPGEWNSSESGHPGIFADADGRTHLFFQGNPDKGRTWWLSKVGIDWVNGRPRVVE